MTFLKNFLNEKVAKWFVLAAMAVAFFTVCYNTTALINALPVIASELHINIVNLQWVINGYVLLAVSFIALSGKLCDIFNKKRVFIFGALGYLVFSIIIALSWNQFSLISGRALQGLFAAFITSSTLTIIKTTFTDEEVVLAIGIWTALIGVGNAIGPFIGGVITTYLGWRYIFWLNIILMSFSIIIAQIAVKDIQKIKQKIPIDYIGAVVLIVGLFLLVFALVKGNTWGLINIKTITFFILGIIVLVIFRIIEKRKSYAIIDFKYFRNKMFLFSSFGVFITIASTIIIPYFLNFYLQNTFILGYSPVLAGASLLPFSFSILLASLLLPKINKLFSFYYILPISLIILAVGLLGIALCSITINYKLILLFLILSGFGLGMTMPVFPKIALGTFSKQNIGQGSGLVNTVVYFADLLAVALGSIIFYFFGGKIILTTIKKIPLAHINKHFLINAALLGDKASKIHISSFSKLKHIFIPLAQHAAITAFLSVIIFTLIIIVVYALLCFYFLPKDNIKK